MIEAAAGFTPVANVAPAGKSPVLRGPASDPVNHPEVLRSPAPPQVYKVHEAKEARGPGKSMKLN